MSLVKILDFLAALPHAPQVEEIQDVLAKIPGDRHVLAAIKDDADEEELTSLYGRRFLQRLGYDEKEPIYRQQAELGALVKEVMSQLA